MYSTIIASKQPITNFGIRDGFDYYEAAHDNNLFKLLSDRSIVYTTINTDCREGLLYDTALALQKFKFLNSTHSNLGVLIEVDNVPSPQSQPYIDYLYLLLNSNYQFTCEYDTQTTFTCMSDTFSVPLYSFILFFIKYNNLFKDLEPKDSVCQTDLYSLVDAILESSYQEEDKYVAFATWYFLEAGSIRLLKCYDTAWGNSVTGIVHHTEDTIASGSLLSSFNKFLDKYGLSKTSHMSWINYLLKIQETNSYETQRVRDFGS